MKIKLEKIEKKSHEKRQPSKEGEINNIENVKMKNKIKEIEEKLNKNLS
jgi:hypothetical protein